MLDKFEGVGDAFQFGLGHCGAGKSHSGHGGWLVVGQMFVGHLDAVVVVIDGLVIPLGEV